jgi:hypothetical protein
MITSPFDPTIIKVNLATVTLFGTWFAYWYKSGLARSERERAYVCSLLSSFICSLSSLPLVYTFIKSHGDVNELLIYREWTVIITSFFMTFLVMDLAIGMFYYRAKIDLLTGWIHHITYLGVLSWAIANQYCGVFVTLCVLEIPTCVLALGSVRSTLRRDYVFASSFFATRIVFHLYTMVHIWKFQSFGPVFSAVAAFFPVHCYWFYGKRGVHLLSKYIKKKLIYNLN